MSTRKFTKITIIILAILGIVLVGLKSKEVILWPWAIVTAPFWTFPLLLLTGTAIENVIHYFRRKKLRR